MSQSGTSHVAARYRRCAQLDVCRRGHSYPFLVASACRSVACRSRSSPPEVIPTGVAPFVGDEAPWILIGAAVQRGGIVGTHGWARVGVCGLGGRWCSVVWGVVVLGGGVVVGWWGCGVVVLVGGDGIGLRIGVVCVVFIRAGGCFQGRKRVFVKIQRKLVLNSFWLANPPPNPTVFVKLAHCGGMLFVTPSLSALTGSIAGQSIFVYCWVVHRFVLAKHLFLKGGRVPKRQMAVPRIAKTRVFVDAYSVHKVVPFLASLVLARAIAIPSVQ